MLRGAYLTLFVGAVIPIPVPPPVLDCLVGAQVTTSATDRSGFQLQFEYAKTSLIATALLPTGLLDPGIRIILVATVGFIPTVIMDGMVTRQDVVPSSSPGKTMLTLTGEDIAVAMSLVDLTGVMQYPGLSPSFRVLTILGRYAAFGVIPEVIPSPFEEPTLPTERIFPQQGTDYDYVKSLATETGYVFYIDHGPLPGMNTAYWGPEKRFPIRPPQSALNINMDAETNVESLTFNYNGLQGKTEIALIQEPTTHIPIPVPSPPISVLSPPLAIRPPTKLKVSFQREAANRTPVQALAKLLNDARESADAISATGSLDVLRYGGILEPRKLVGVRGAGVAYDGFYYVKSVTHSIKPGEYKQTFSLARNGLVSITPVVRP